MCVFLSGIGTHAYVASIYFNGPHISFFQLFYFIFLFPFPLVSIALHLPGSVSSFSFFFFFSHLLLQTNHFFFFRRGGGIIRCGGKREREKKKGGCKEKEYRMKNSVTSLPLLRSVYFVSGPFLSLSL